MVKAKRKVRWCGGGGGGGKNLSLNVRFLLTVYH